MMWDFIDDNYLWNSPWDRETGWAMLCLILEPAEYRAVIIRPDWKCRIEEHA